jgi:hypothetical protein
MYVGDSTRPLSVLEGLVLGYYSALHTHGIVEAVPEMARHFSVWLCCRTSWSTSCGWAQAIASHSKRRPQLDVFFDFVDDYRQLAPTTISVAKPRRVSSKPKRPTRVEIVRYRPTRFHFLRLSFGRRVQNGDILMNGDGSHHTSIAFANAAPHETSASPTLTGRRAAAA